MKRSETNTQAEILTALSLVLLVFMGWVKASIWMTPIDETDSAVAIYALRGILLALGGFTASYALVSMCRATLARTIVQSVR